MNRYIRFDWAAKNMLRNKADFAIFEGLISVPRAWKLVVLRAHHGGRSKDEGQLHVC